MRTWRVLTGFSVALAIGFICLAAAPSERPVNQPAKGPQTPGQPASTQRAADPAHPVGTYPPPELAAACRQEAQRLGKSLNRSFEVTVSPPFVVAGNMSASEVEQYAASSVVGPAKAMWSAYFRKKPDQVITVLLFNDDATYRAWAKKLFSDTDVAHFGYYKPDKQTLVMNISTGSGTLVHELTHALVVYDFPDQPTWFNEGLASLHEQCQVGQDDITGLVNWRLPGLQTAIKDGTLRPLRELVTKDDFRGPLMGLNYAHARYFVQYMQQQGLLKKFYAYFRDHHAGDDAAVKAIEHVFGRKIDDIDKDFVAWVKTLRFPPR